MDRDQKRALADHLRGVFAQASVVVVTHYSGMTVGELNDLRRRAGAVGAGVKVTKNRIAKIAADGTPVGVLAPLFTGPTAIAYSDDPVAAPKVIADFAKGNAKLIVVGGVIAGRLLDPAGVEQLATLPSLDQLRARLVGMIQTPATRVAGILQAPAGQVARVIQAYADKAAA
jgi:large subunit ribosomal protein L10